MANPTARITFGLFIGSLNLATFNRKARSIKEEWVAAAFVGVLWCSKACGCLQQSD
jgi:hypothetical protein